MHLMIDIETGGVTPGCAIFSIGACGFDPQNQEPPTPTFYKEISHDSCRKLGLNFEKPTMDWWESHGTPPNGEEPIIEVIHQFNLWLSNIPTHHNQKITAHWANSPSFDIVLLKHVFSLCKKTWPFPYTQERDLRTLKAIAFPNQSYHLGNSHNALEDAINQARFVQLAYLNLGLSIYETRNDHQPNPIPG